VTAVAPPRRREGRFSRPGPIVADLPPRTPAPPPEPVARQDRPNRGTWALVALVLVCIAGGVIAALIGGGGDNDANRSAATASKHSTSTKHKAAAPSKAKAHTTSTAAASTPAAQPQTTNTAATPPADNRSAAQLNNAGFAMLPGNPQGAIPLIQKALQKFQAAGDTSSVDYAYALYNMGWALQLANSPAEAIPYFQQRLAISDDRRGLVEQHLREAQQAAGQAPTDGKGKGKKPKKD
jgi:hypothetical protein